MITNIILGRTVWTSGTLRQQRDNNKTFIIIIIIIIILVSSYNHHLRILLRISLIVIIILGRTVWTSGTLRQRSRRSSCTPLCQRLSLRCSCRPDDHNGDLGDEDDGDD